ncbi:MAG: Spx/MgsR family RNA polymerase-binding regulatory protein [Cyclobacteriaceae bacterium]|nr:Spx/MgsR family RNA polymerase-binding regulatory protein [Cyclobacteriaceae bacterium]
MKKTFDFLNEEGIAYEFIDYKKTAPNTGLLKKFIGQVGLESLINKRGTTFKKLSDTEKMALEDKDSAVGILTKKSSMIKRPIIEFPDGELVLGFEPNQIKNKFNH